MLSSGVRSAKKSDTGPQRDLRNAMIRSHGVFHFILFFFRVPVSETPSLLVYA